jgi:hypothetical protein
LKEKLIKIGAKVVSHRRYVAFQMAEVAIPRQMFQEILRLIAASACAGMRRRRSCEQPQGRVCPNARENGQISPSTSVRAARRAGSRLHLASVLQDGRKTWKIHTCSGVIWGIPA